MSSSPFERPSLFGYNSNSENEEYNGYNSNNNHTHPRLMLEFPPNSPVAAINKKENARILKEQYISKNFENILPKGSPQSLNTIINNSTKIPDKAINFEGASSKAGLYKLPDGESYIVRKTQRTTLQLQNRLLNELNCYKVIQEDENSKNYISELVYADVLIAGGKNVSYFIFKYEPGMRLDAFIEENKNKLSAPDVLKIYEYLLQGIEFIGSKGIVHRDIKPQNIWFSLERNIPLIFDFDGSCIGKESCSTAEFTGTSNYATPHSLSLRNSSSVSNGFFSNSPVKTYTYTTTYDKYGALKVLENDLIKLVKPKEKYIIEKRIAIDKEKLDKENAPHLLGGYRNCRVGVMNPTWGGKIQGKRRSKTMKKRKGGACGCQQLPKLPTPLGETFRGMRGGYRARSANYTPKKGGYKARSANYTPSGGYKATKRNLKYLKLWKKGKSIGFTMKSSLKAKGLIPRANGTYRVSPKYRK
jgi:hypothetical protein